MTDWTGEPADGDDVLAEIMSALVEQQRRGELLGMARDDFANRFRRLLCAELDWDQLEALLAVLRCIADGDRPRALAAYYEGLCAGAMGVRQELLGHGPQAHDAIAGK